VLVAGSVYYLVATLRVNAAQLRGIRWLEHPWLLVASVAVNVLALTAGCWNWWTVLSRVSDAAPPFPTLWRLWALSNPARYVPGRVWHVAALGTLASAAGIAWAPLVTSLLFHMWFVLLANLVLALTAIRPPSAALWVAYVGGGAAIVVVGTWPRALDLLSRITRKPELSWSGRWRFGGSMVLLNLVSVIVAGFGACLLVRGTVGLPLHDFPRMIAAQAAAFLVGYVSLVPAGLGVREAALTVLLAPVLPPGSSAVVAVVLRLWNTVTELLLLGGALRLTR
jgi:uncharacterized membrane protein YbhN (UPF0104 family)